MKYCLYQFAVFIRENPFYAMLNLTLFRSETSVLSARSFQIIITDKDFVNRNALLNV